MNTKFYICKINITNIMKQIDDLKLQIEKACRFCNPPEPERILYQTEHFYVMVSLGPIIEGYLLIITKEHIGACLNIPESLFEEFLSVKEKVREILTNEYGHCLFYEHGKIGSSLTINDHFHCLHAHMHCIPSSIQLNDYISKDIAGIEHSNIYDCYNYMKGLEKYLLVEDNRIMTYVPTGSIRKQYLRYMLAKHLNVENRWDWVNNQNWELIDKSIKRLKPVFQ